MFTKVLTHVITLCFGILVGIIFTLYATAISFMGKQEGSYSIDNWIL